jgi:hypothetical protein
MTERSQLTDRLLTPQIFDESIHVMNLHVALRLATSRSHTDDHCSPGDTAGRGANDDLPEELSLW